MVSHLRAVRIAAPLTALTALASTCLLCTLCGVRNAAVRPMLRAPPGLSKSLLTVACARSVWQNLHSHLRLGFSHSMNRNRVSILTVTELVPKQIARTGSREMYV